MKKTLALILAAVFAVSALSGCNNTPVNNDTDKTVVEDTSAKLTYSQVQDQIKELAEKQDIDNTVVMTIGDYKMSLAEYRYYYMYWVNQFTYYYGTDWQNNSEQSAEFEQYVEQDSKMAGIIVNLCEDRNIFITQNEFDDSIVKTHNEIKAQYGENSDSILYNDFFATPNFLLENQSAYILYNKLYESYCGNGGEFFEEIKNQTLEFYENSDNIRAKHILIMFPTNSDGSAVTDEQKAEAKAKAEEVLAKVKAGGDFDALIAEYNEDPGMTSNPDGYYFGKGEMVAEFETAAYALEEGGVSDIVETTYGYHIIKRLPINDEAISSSTKFIELGNTKFNEVIAKILEETVPEKAENFDELVKPVHEEGTTYIADIILQQAAANAEAEKAEENAENTEAAE